MGRLLRDSRPEAAELVAVASALALARGRETSLHIVHVGTAAAAELAQAAGASCETCAHYLGSAARTSAPRKALERPSRRPRSSRAGRAREALGAPRLEGTIDFLASDHAPCTREEKETGDVWTAYGGIPGVGTGFPYLYSEGLVRGRLTLPRFLEASSGAAARRYGLSARKGSIAPGQGRRPRPRRSRALRTRIEGERLLSKGKITPFEGMVLSGAIAATYVRGAPRLRRPVTGRSSAEPGYGRFLTWGYA